MDYTKLIVTDEEGKSNINVEELKKLLQVEGDRRATEASKTVREKTEQELRDSIRKEVEEEAKLTAEDKAKKTIEEANKKLEQRILDFNKKQVTSMFEEKKIAKEDYESFLEFVSVDTDKSIDLARRHISSIEKIADAKYQEQIKSNMDANSTPPANGENGQSNPKKPKIVTTF